MAYFLRAGIKGLDKSSEFTSGFRSRAQLMKTPLLENHVEHAKLNGQGGLCSGLRKLHGREHGNEIRFGDHTRATIRFRSFIPY